MSNASPFDVAIIGGGAAGTLVAIHLLQASRAQARIAVVEARAALGEGAAYSTRQPDHLLNVIAERMSAFDSDPGHFVRYLEQRDAVRGDSAGDIATATRFARRMDYAEYLRDTLATLADPARLHCRDEAVELVDGPAYTIGLRSGVRIQARAVVLALGNFVRPLPIAVAPAATPSILHAWDYAAVAGLPPDADVCIAGSGLSMVDAVVSLAQQQHRGRIVVVSRHGLLPLAHARPGSQDSNVDALTQLGLRQRVSALRGQVAERARAGEPWQWSMDRLRRHGPALWRSLDPRDQRRFLRHVVRLWDIHRHRIAPNIAAVVDGLRRSGQLEVLAGHLRAVDADAAQLRLLIQPRRTQHTRVLRISHLINCTGVETRLQRMHSPLLASLGAQGMVAPGPHEIGMACDAQGALLAADGTPQPRLLTLGAMRIGQCWESIAIPELRGQAEQIGARLAAAR